MTQEDKELLLKDLCARLSYEVKVQYDNEIFNIDYISSYEEIKLDIPDRYTIDIAEIKPYLRPMSSMTEEEKNEFIHYVGYEVEESVNGRHYEYYLKDYVGTPEKPSCNCDAIDWLNARHFDYRGLIEKGLAIEATEDMYNNKEE